MIQPILIPLLNTNEPEAQLAALHIVSGEHVLSGQSICTLETTKTTAEVVAAAEGYIVGLRFRLGDTLLAGDTLCYLAESPDEVPEQLLVGQSKPEQMIDADSGKSDDIPPAGLRISQPALNLARR
jgi:pyruvate/2-oxoglutarate dehydrogenase complex dihydrolipoamide acyltransferase (E2) component